MADFEKQMIQLGIVGSGKIVQDFLPILSNFGAIEKTAICGTARSEEKVKKMVSEYGFESAFFDYDAFLESDVNVVYVAVPNHLHFEFSRKALEKGKNVIVEKPFVSNGKEAKILEALAIKKHRFLFEAINNQYLPNYEAVKRLLPKLGRLKLIQCNYSQLSSRYAAFCKGEILPAFDKNCSGGALMDLNMYNLHYVVGLFGAPKHFDYMANVERAIDTSGVLTLDYGNFKCICSGAKDSDSPGFVLIQGEKGYILQKSPANLCEHIEYHLEGDLNGVIDENRYKHRMEHEFMAMFHIIRSGDAALGVDKLNHSVLVSEIQTVARKQAGIIFPSDAM